MPTEQVETFIKLGLVQIKAVYPSILWVLKINHTCPKRMKKGGKAKVTGYCIKV